MSNWSPQQLAALKDVTDWFTAKDAPQIYRLFGYAGTGKTTLAIEIADVVRKLMKKKKKSGFDAENAVLFAAFTGKAALVMRSKGCHGATTLHSLIYTTVEGAGGVPRFELNPASKLDDAELLIVDECSMVGAELAADVLSFHKKVLVLGDPAQLPPVKDAGYFTETKPDTMLTEVHRQAADNPIIRMSMDVRNGVALDYGDFGACKIVPWKREAITPERVLSADQLLCGRNATRTSMNGKYRALKNYKRETPLVGEKLVCLKNDRSKNLFNGGLWRVENLRKFNPEAVRMVIAPEDAGEVQRNVEVKLHPWMFQGREAELPWEKIKEYQQMTFGYALTVHKAQGSQWDDVILFDESGVFREDARRWLYTGITRAAKTLTVVM